MDKIDLKISLIAIVIISIITCFVDYLLAFSFIVGFLGFLGYYYFLQLRIDNLLRKQNKFIFYLSIILSMVMMALPFGLVTLVSPTAMHYVGVALGFIIFKIIINIKGILKKDN